MDRKVPFEAQASDGSALAMLHQEVLQTLEKEPLPFWGGPRALLPSMCSTHLIRAEVVRWGQQKAMVIAPIGAPIELKSLGAQLGGECSPTLEGVEWPLPALYEGPVFVDERLQTWDRLYFLARENPMSSKEAVLPCVWSMTAAQFKAGRSDEVPPMAWIRLETPSLEQRAHTTDRAKAQLKGVGGVATMPPMVDALLKLRVNPHSTASQLASIVEQDPSLTAQVLAWSNSSFYGSRQTIVSVKEAIIRVLGYDLVMNLALAAALGAPMQLPQEGDLGLLSYWRGAVYASAMMDKLLSTLGLGSKLKRSVVHLCGLLHNFGHLILGQYFRTEFEQLRLHWPLNRSVDRVDLERTLFGFSHVDLGRWLFEQWHLPSVLIEAMSEHHHLGTSNPYAQLLGLSNALLSYSGMGECPLWQAGLWMRPHFILQENQYEKVAMTVKAFMADREALDKLTAFWIQPHDV